MTNFAENQKRVWDNPTIADVEHQAREHRAYGWSRRHTGGWSNELIAAYDAAYEKAGAS